MQVIVEHNAMGELVMSTKGMGEPGSELVLVSDARGEVAPGSASDNSDYAAALRIIEEFEREEPHSGSTEDLWSYCHKRLNALKAGHCA